MTSRKNLDTFADLTLGASDEEGDGELEPTTQSSRAGSIAQYASMLSCPVDPTTITNHVKTLTPSLQHDIAENQPEPISSSQPPAVKKPRKKRKSKAKTNKWADRCMYAELLEMVDDPSETWRSSNTHGLPEDIESGWVALGPVPQGKRCLAITQSAVGVPSYATLRSRLLGKVLLSRFPCVLPPHTVLDCILDTHWKENGVLHVLDVVKWKGQDVSDCESAFRFWWRDTRLGELPVAVPPPPSDASIDYAFPYPITLLPVPYHSNTNVTSLLGEIIPTIRAPRFVSVRTPTLFPQGINTESSLNKNIKEMAIEPDGLLLYVKAASYESGTSPLSSWVPLVPDDDDNPNPDNPRPLDLFERLVFWDLVLGSSQVFKIYFHLYRLLQRRVQKVLTARVDAADVEMEL
ncbi:hypothetical protein H0H93_008995 [Arthromyces matolae]|nr:hypothetical protein H0H93_008995 [Arthromyces matolae]